MKILPRGRVKSSQKKKKKLSLLSKYSVAIYFTDSFEMYELHPSLRLLKRF